MAELMDNIREAIAGVVDVMCSPNLKFEIAI